MLLDFPLNAWILLAVEFAERLAYYGVAFSLTTYSVNMLNMSAEEANLVVNGLYAVSPLAACISGGLSDGSWGRRRCLLLFGIAYSIGLAMIATSSLPVMYADFPNGPSSTCVIFLVLGMMVFAAGYGGMKVCTSPLMADCVVTDFAASGKGEMSELVLGRLFRYAYWVINFGSLFGIIGAPFLREADSRKKVDGDETDTTGYYFGFWMCALSTSTGMCLFALRYKHFPQNNNKLSRPFVMFRILWRALCNRIRLMMCDADVTEEEIVMSKTFSSFIDFAMLDTLGANMKIEREKGGDRPTSMVSSMMETEETSLLGGRSGGTNQRSSPTGQEREEPTNEDDLSASLCSPSAVRSLRQTLFACRIFLPLPIYWLLSNQFSTNVVLLANSMDLPAGIPPEAFNNVNTVTVLIGVVALDKLVLPYVYPKPQHPSVVWRMVAGFFFSMSSMVVCAMIQVVVDDRGSYDSSGDYELSAGKSKVHAMWLIVPYVLQGLASVLVDTTAMESAYTLSSPEFKSSVMALYLLASSASGFLGLAIAPFVAPTKMSMVFFSLAAVQGFVAVFFAGVVREPVRNAAVCPPPPPDAEILEVIESV